jgi:hypothetical protein
MHIVHTTLTWTGYVIGALSCACWLYATAFLIGLTG